MTITAKPLSASQDFIDFLSPKKNLRKWLQNALADDDLALFFMYTDPPSPEECRYGVQLIDKDKLPIPPNAYSSRISGHYSYAYQGAEFMGFTDAASLLSDDWLEDFEKLSQLKETPINHDGLSTINLVPSADSKSCRVPIRFNNPYTRTGLLLQSRWVDLPYKWAVLARKSGFNPRLRSWHSGRHSQSGYDTYYRADQLLFDFRGGIPLTVGTVGSDADVWLGEQLTYIDTARARGRSFDYPSSVEVSRVHVPTLGGTQDGNL